MHYIISYGVESSLSNTQIFYSQNSITLRGSREKLALSALQKVNKNANVSWGLDGWGRWPRNLGHYISKSLFSLRTLWVITESFCCKLFDINSLASDQTLMDEIQILKKNQRMGGALSGSHSKNCTCKEMITYSEMERSFQKRWKAYEISNFHVITCVVYIQLAKYLMPQSVSETLHAHWNCVPWCRKAQREL